MRIEEEINKRLRLAMLNKRESSKNVLRFLKGKLDLMKHKTNHKELPDAEVHKVIKGLLKESVEVPTMFNDHEIVELRDLSRWAMSSGIVPEPLTQDQIGKLINDSPGLNDKIRLAADDGRAVGMAMGALKGQPVEPSDVRECVMKIRV